jgi:hypothetical protein
MGAEDSGYGQDRARGQPPLACCSISCSVELPLLQIRIRITLSRRQLAGVHPIMCKFAAMLKINLQMRALVVQLNTRVNQAQSHVAANALARQAQAAAHGAANVDCFRPAAPPKYGDKKKGEHVDHWIPVIEDYL